MIPKNVALCGAPLAGKSSLVEAISRRFGSTFQRVEGEKLERICKTRTIQSQGQAQRTEIEWNTAAGSLFYFEDVVMDLIQAADFILYVVANPFHGPDLMFQRRFYEDHLRILQEAKFDVGSLSVILSKCDGEGRAWTPTPSDFPCPLSTSTRTSSVTGDGIDEVVDHVAKRLQEHA